MRLSFTVATADAVLSDVVAVEEEGKHKAEVAGSIAVITMALIDLNKGTHERQLT